MFTKIKSFVAKNKKIVLLCLSISTLILTVVAITILVNSNQAAKANKKLTSGISSINRSETKKESNQNKNNSSSIESLQSNSETIIETNSSNAGKLKASSIASKKHVHEYTSKTIPPTCTVKGYTIHTCKSCGDSYKDAYSTPQHTYINYLCKFCGQPSRSEPIQSLRAWILKNGTLYDNGKAYYIAYGNYSISTLTYEYNKVNDDIQFVYDPNNESTESLLINMIDDISSCDIHYEIYKDRICGYVNLNPSKVNASTTLKLDNFNNYNGIQCTEEEFAQKMSDKLNDLINTIQDKLLYPKTGLKFKDFGFTSY
ncbi:hypothetical protein RBG61_11105 [Paludicola sp. MB14-C6]|uniref:hypothetical protein n=1 Tax=Paludihabitans sp. MB14-C6 TaxID=3070656 RepID=UPI0027DDFB25|nr:hypothetical protein [Paludicola sp. MB14-C6]WMJ22532.1 hypothetical protein RBG61_11105 [Paludicola sp. MB14-C6]